MPKNTMAIRLAPAKPPKRGGWYTPANCDIAGPATAVHPAGTGDMFPHVKVPAVVCTPVVTGVRTVHFKVWKAMRTDFDSSTLAAPGLYGFQVDLRSEYFLPTFPMSIRIAVVLTDGRMTDDMRDECVAAAADGEYDLLVVSSLGGAVQLDQEDRPVVNIDCRQFT